MKPFNLDKALKGKKVLLRCGKVATIAACNKDAAEDEVLIGWCEGSAECWCIDGAHIPGRKLSYDIIGMCPEKKSARVVLAKDADGYIRTFKFDYDVSVGDDFQATSLATGRTCSATVLATTVLEYEE